MPKASSAALERRVQEYTKRAAKSKKLSLPSWWRSLAPKQGPRFWCIVDAMRKEAGIERWDQSGIAYIVDKLNRRMR